ncbi:galactokinase [Leucobacter exalbidus]|uniref:Galactokinase n=1 Tax=Leucobacter exalbidus TaxID=662960 RepID=A0A940T3Y4_9MICO|nr:galactokinase [Leucobacter exalbidus]MBP1326283.1 galactokinase [Leucobacter exalbidus]
MTPAAAARPATPATKQIAAEFLARFGRAAAGVWSAPGRVNLIGEHTDYNAGFALPFAIGQRTYVAAAPRTDGRMSVASDAFDDAVEVSVDELATLFPQATGPGEAAQVPEWAAYPLGVAWALMALAPAGTAFTGYDLLFTSEVPLGAGLSSSAALESATAVALDELWGLSLDRRTLARAGQRAENEAVGAPTGIMDQTATLLGAADHGVLIDCRDLSTTLVPLNFANEDLQLLVIDTRVRHAHASGGYGERRASCELGAATLALASLRELTVDGLAAAETALDDTTYRRVRHVVTENHRVEETVRVLGEQGPRAIGALMTASHVSLRDDFEVSVPELDLAVDAAVAAGALGARMTGGGFGGAAIALVDAAQAETVAQAVRAAFSAAGFAEPNLFAVVPADGALREQ